MSTKEDYYPVILFPAAIEQFIVNTVGSDALSVEPPEPILLASEASSRPTVNRKIVYWLLSFLVLAILALVGHVPKIFVFGIGLVAIAVLVVKQREYSLEEQTVAIAPPTPMIMPPVGTIDLRDRQQKLAALLQNRVTIPSGVSTAQPGVSEKYFERFLREYFGDLVLVGEELAIPGIGYKYSTDFSLFDRITNLRLDIEIDEPYEGKKKTPHHCSDDPRDTNRNHFFLQGNWVVVRFSEEQVVRYPNSCCRAIAEVINKITGDNSYLSRLANIPVLQPQRRWNSTRAALLADWNYRLKYLKEAGVYFPPANQFSGNKRRRSKSKRKKY